MYFRGPTVGGSECGGIAAQCIIAARVALRTGDVVYLTGYNRGGAIAIAVAKRIRAEFPNARVLVMALFDAVDEERMFGDLRTIPGNVDCAFHARRDPIVQSRSYFGNCGTRAEAPCKLEPLTFVTTHRGMGGVPLGSPPPIQEKIRIKVSPEMEQRQPALVHRRMWANLRKEGDRPLTITRRVPHTRPLCIRHHVHSFNGCYRVGVSASGLLALLGN